MPRIYNPYTPGEAKAFSVFEHANDLAEALTSVDYDRKRSAVSAMREIGHVKTSYWNWFRGSELFSDIRVVGVIEQKTLENDLYEMLGRLGINDEINIPTDSVTTHRNNYKDVPQLSDLAKENLKEWYSQDYHFISLCEMWKSKTKIEDKLIDWLSDDYKSQA